MDLLTFVTFSSLVLTAYVYVGYPLILGLVAQWRARPARQAAITPAVSLVIAAYNEEGVIGRKIENSLALAYPQERLEIIVVADGSSDGTAAVARRYAGRGVKVLHHPARQGKSAALNRGAAAAGGEMLVFSDANAFYLPDALAKLVRNFADPGVGGVSGQKTVRESESAVSHPEGLYWRYESAIKHWESNISSTTGVVGEMMALRRTLFEPLPPEIICDDAYLAYSLLRQGWRVVYESEAVSWETSALSTAGEMTRRRNINAGRYQLLFRPGLWPWGNGLVLFQLASHKFGRLLLPFFMLAALLSNALVVILDPGLSSLWLLRLILGAQLGFYGLAAIGCMAEGRRWKLKLAAVAWYLTSSNLASLQGLVRYLQGKQTVLWDKVARAEVEGWRAEAMSSHRPAPTRGHTL